MLGSRQDDTTLIAETLKSLRTNFNIATSTEVKILYRELSLENMEQDAYEIVNAVKRLRKRYKRNRRKVCHTEEE